MKLARLTLALVALALAPLASAQSFVVNSFVIGTADPAPTLTTATLTGSTTLVLSFSEPVSIGSGGNGGFTVSLSGGAATLTYASGSDTDELTYTVSRPVLYTETGTLDYAQPGDGLEDSIGTDLASVSGFTITNSIPSFTAATAVFDGTSDYLSLAGSPAAWADGKAFTGSFWLKMESGSDGTLYQIAASSSNRFGIQRTAGNKLRLFGQSSGGTTAIDVETTTNITVASGWVHVFFCYDTATAAGTKLRKIYLNGVSDTLTETTFTNTTIDASNTAWRIGSTSTNTNRLAAALAEFWLDDSYLDDPTKFAAGGHPISLGATGNTPTGSAPAMYYSLNGSGNSWAVDSSGNGNTLTVTGSLLTATPP